MQLNSLTVQMMLSLTLLACGDVAPGEQVQLNGLEASEKAPALSAPQVEVVAAPVVVEAEAVQASEEEAVAAPAAEEAPVALSTAQASYVITETSEVRFALDVPASVTGTHTLRLPLWAPGSFLHQEYRLTFSTTEAAAPGSVQAEATETGFRVWVSFPVAGTDVEAFFLSGDWRAEAFLDDASEASAQVAFALN